MTNKQLSIWIVIVCYLGLGFLLGCPTPPASTKYSGSVQETSATKLARLKIQAPPLTTPCLVVQVQALKNSGWELAGDTITVVANLPAGTVYGTSPSTMNVPVSCQVVVNAGTIDYSQSRLYIMPTTQPQTVNVYRGTNTIPDQVVVITNTK
jgi:hypothetical protein